MYKEKEHRFLLLPFKASVSLLLAFAAHNVSFSIQNGVELNRHFTVLAPAKDQAWVLEELMVSIPGYFYPFKMKAPE